MEFNHQKQAYEPTIEDFNKCIKENQTLKNRWQELKDLLMLFYTVSKTSGINGFEVYNAILDKMEELEKEGSE